MTYMRTKAQERRFRELEAAYHEEGAPPAGGPEPPPEPRPQRVIAKTEEAIHHLDQAIRLLDEARDLADWGSGRGDLMEFTQRLREILSCDHDEAGLQPLLRLLRQKTH